MPSRDCRKSMQLSALFFATQKPQGSRVHFACPRRARALWTRAFWVDAIPGVYAKCAIGELSSLHVGATASRASPVTAAPRVPNLQFSLSSVPPANKRHCPMQIFHLCKALSKTKMWKWFAKICRGGGARSRKFAESPRHTLYFIYDTARSRERKLKMSQGLLWLVRGIASAGFSPFFADLGFSGRVLGIDNAAAHGHDFAPREVWRVFE